MKKTLTLIAASALAVSAFAAPAQYSKLGIVTAMKRLGKLEAMNNWIQTAGYWNEWLACQVFADDYAGFSAITNAAISTGLITPAEAEVVLAEARITKSGSDEIDALIAVVESNKAMREKYHGGRIGTYILTNEVGRLIRVDLYADATCWTNGSTTVNKLVDPEAAAKAAAAAAAEKERVIAAWEAANLPADLAALRAAQREAKRQEEASEE